MSDSEQPGRPWHHAGNFAGLALLAVLLFLWLALPGRRPDLGDWSAWLAGAIPLVIAAIAQSQVILAGGQGLAAGATALLVTALLTSRMGDSIGSMMAWTAAGLLLGGAIGACNGILIGFLRLPSTAVTLATSFSLGGVTLTLTGLSPSTSPEGFRSLFTGALWGLPLPILLTAVLLVVAVVLDRSPIGRKIRAAGAGGWRRTASRRGAWVALAYAIAGLGYGASGVIMASEFGISDPITSGPSLLEIYAAVALGGSVPYMCQGSSLGAAFGALAIASLSYLTLRLGLPDYATPALTGLLLLAGLWRARAGLPPDRSMDPPPAHPLRYPIVCLALPIMVVALLASGSPGAILHIDPLVLLMAGMLALAQGSVVVTGHLDLSLPSIMATAGLAAVALTQGSDAAVSWAIPLILGLGAAIGLVNGALGQWLKGPRVLVTLAATGFLGTASVYLAFAWPNGFAPPILMSFMNRTQAMPAPAILTLAPPLLMAVVMLATPAARAWLRRLARDPQPPGARRAAPLVHGFAGLLAATMGIMLAGYGGQAPLSAAEPFTLPSLLAIETAGLTVGRRGGNPLLLILAVPMVLGLDMLMLGLGLAYGTRVAVMGLALLASVVVQGLRRAD